MQCLAFSDDKKLAIGSFSSVTIKDIETNAKIFSRWTFKGSYTSLHFITDFEFIAVCERSKQIFKYDTRELNNPTSALKLPYMPPVGVVQSPTNPYEIIISHLNSQISKYNLITGSSKVIVI